MHSYRTLGLSRGAGSPARSCPSAVLLPAVARSELSRLQGRKMGRKMGTPVASRATELPPLGTQAKTRRASQAWRDTRPHAPKAGSSPGRAPAPLSGLAANSPICARSVRGTRKPRAACRDQVGGSLRRPRTRARSRPAAPKPQKRPTYSPAGCHCPNRNGDMCAPDTSRRSASRFRCR